MKKLHASTRGLVTTTLTMIEALKGSLEGATSDMEDYVSGRSEKWQESETAERYTSWKESVEDVISSLEEAFDKLQEMPEQLPEE